MIRTSWRKNAGSRRNKYFARTSGKDATGIHTKDIRLAGHWEGDVRVIPGDHSYKSKPNHELRFANIDDALPSEFKHHPWKTAITVKDVINMGGEVALHGSRGTVLNKSTGASDVVPK